MTKNKCIVLIDGSNFYFKLKDLYLQNLLNFDFSHKPSIAMVANCSESQLLKREDLEKFLIKELNS